MYTNGSEPILFDLEEKISFRQGEEIDDLYGISIQPDINVFKEANYIQLRGVLMVSGEYQSVPDQEPVYLVEEDQDEENYVQQVKALDNGFTTFQYPVPVDITIPNNRVRETGDPEVDIEYFDYELPEPKSLHIFAKIRLDGVELSESEEERHEFDTDFELKAIPDFEERTEQPTDEQEHEPVEQLDPVPNLNADSENSEEAEVDHDQEKDREFWKKKQSQSFAEFFDKKEKQNQEEAQAQEEVMDVTHDVEETVEAGVVTEEGEEEADHSDNEIAVNMEADATDNELEESPDDQKVTPNGETSPIKKGLNYLSNLFRNDENEPDKVQLKIRFVQENETLDQIANNYEISVAKLERLNGLEEGHELQTGDVLYVPFKTKQSN